jgi:hypothetical protein
VEADRFEPLRAFIEARLVPGPEGPTAGPSLRSAVRALLDLVSQLGVMRTRQVLEAVRDPEVEGALAPLALAILRIVEGQVDGVERYEVTDAASRFVRTCDPDNLLGALEALLRLESRVEPGRPWIAVVFGRLEAILADPTAVPFLESFEREAARGRPAVVGLMARVMSFLALEVDPVPRVETLLESAVYPLVSAALEAKIRALLEVLGEATTPRAGVYGPLRGAMQCGNRQPGARDVLLGFLFDLAVTAELGVRGVLEGAAAFSSSSELELALLADLLAAVRADVGARDELRSLLALVLEAEPAASVLPVLLELVEAGVLAELVDAAVQLLEGCSAAQGAP